MTEDVDVDGSGNLSTGGALTITDVDQNQSSFAAQPSTAGTYGTFILLADGDWTYTADNSQPRSSSSAPANRSPTASRRCRPTARPASW